MKNNTFLTTDGDNITYIWNTYKYRALMDDAPIKFQNHTPMDYRKAHIGKPCPCCGIAMEYKGRKAATIDHIIPKNKAPHLMFNYTNFEVICLDCNHEKGSRNLELEQMQQIVSQMDDYLKEVST